MPTTMSAQLPLRQARTVRRYLRRFSLLSSVRRGQRAQPATIEFHVPPVMDAVRALDFFAKACGVGTVEVTATVTQPLPCAADPA